MAKLTSMHFYAWEKGLKTGMYYLRTKAATDAIKFTVQKQTKSEVEPVVSSKQTESITAKEVVPAPAPVPSAAPATDSKLVEAKAVGEIRASELAQAVKEAAAMSPEEQLNCSLDNADDCVACGS